MKTLHLPSYNVFIFWTFPLTTIFSHGLFLMLLWASLSPALSVLSTFKDNFPFCSYWCTTDPYRPHFPVKPLWHGNFGRVMDSRGVHCRWSPGNSTQGSLVCINHRISETRISFSLALNIRVFFLFSLLNLNLIISYFDKSQPQCFSIHIFYI